jgi:hypothetical protein
MAFEVAIEKLEWPILKSIKLTLTSEPPSERRRPAKGAKAKQDLFSQ